MALVGEELYSLLVPLWDDRLIVPRSCIAEVVRYAPTADANGSEEWLRDTIVWREREVPVLSLEAMLGKAVPKVSGRTRVVVFNPLSGDSCPAYGILAQGFPQMVRVNSEVVQPDRDYRVVEGSPVICRISLLNEYALIPDLEMLESLLMEQVV
jgi:chemosensory pili system protein ChpC